MNHSGYPDYTGGGYVTQFLITIPIEFHNYLTKKLKYTDDNTSNLPYGGKFIPASWEGGYFELAITDRSGKTSTLKLNPASVGIYRPNNVNIYRFESCEAGYLIQHNNVYSITLKIYIGNKLAHYGTVKGITFEDEHIYQSGKIKDTSYYEYPVTTKFCHYVGTDWKKTDFEDHTEFGRNLLLGIPVNNFVNFEDLENAKAVIVLDGKTYESTVSSVWTNVTGMAEIPGTGQLTYSSVSCYLIRIAFSKFPAAGEYKDSSIKLYRKGDNQLLYSGTTTIYSTNKTDVVPEPDAPAVVVSNVQGAPGETVDVQVSLKNNPGITSINFEMAYPSDLSIVSVNPYDKNDKLLFGGIDALWYTLTTPASLAENPKAFAWGADQLPYNLTQNGLILTVRFKISDDAVPGTIYPITILDNSKFSNCDFEIVSFVSQNGSITVTEIRYGDINGNGSVNAADRTYLARALAGWSGYTVSLNTGDVNRDGKLNAADRTYLARALAGWSGYTL